MTVGKQGILRKVKADDLELLYIWANDDEVRRNSFSTGKIEFDEHTSWFNNMLLREDVIQYVYEMGGEPVGQVRLNVEGEKAEISYSIARKYRGKGYGSNMLAELVEVIKADYPKINTLIAQVKPDNTASKNIFKNMGYSERNIVYEKKI